MPDRLAVNPDGLRAASTALNFNAVHVVGADAPEPAGRKPSTIGAASVSAAISAFAQAYAGAADTAQESGYADRGVVYRAADHIRAMAKLANLGAQNLSQARDRALDAISEAETDGFRVGNDLSVTDRRRYSSHDISLYLARKAKAEEHHGYIAMRAGTLASEDAEVGARLNAGAATLDAMIPQHWKKHGGAPQLVPRSIEWVTATSRGWPNAGDFDSVESSRDVDQVHRYPNNADPGNEFPLLRDTRRRLC
jgi:hypothetical protein